MGRTEVKRTDVKRTLTIEQGTIWLMIMVTINTDSSGDEIESEGKSDYYDDEGMDMLDTTEEEKLEKERTVLN